MSSESSKGALKKLLDKSYSVSEGEINGFRTLVEVAEKRSKTNWKASIWFEPWGEVQQEVLIKLDLWHSSQMTVHPDAVCFIQSPGTFRITTQTKESTISLIAMLREAVAALEKEFPESLEIEGENPTKPIETSGWG